MIFAASGPIRLPVFSGVTLHFGWLLSADGAAAATNRVFGVKTNTKFIVTNRIAITAIGVLLIKFLNRFIFFHIVKNLPVIVRIIYQSIQVS
jgi:hypothetical protein